MMRNSYTPSLGGAVTEPLRPVNPSCFNEIGGARERVGILADKVEGIVDRLVGLAPKAGISGDEAHSGLFEQASADARAIDSMVARMMDALKRLEDSLP